MNRFKNQQFELLSESDKSGLTFEIVIIREGLSKNNTYYSKETLLQSRQLFEGAKVAFYEWNHFYDHLSDDARSVVPAGFPTQVAGIVTDVKISKLNDGHYGLVGTLRMSESSRNLADIFILGLENGNREILGFSIDVFGSSEKRTIEGKEVDYITEISTVNEITVVTNPSAGGRLERMVASYGQSKIKLKEKTKMKNDLIRLIAALSHKKLKGVSFLESDEAVLMQLAKDSINDVLPSVKENSEVVAALKAALTALESGDAQATKAAIEAALTAYEAPKEESKPALKTESVDLSGIKKTQEEMEKRLQESEKNLCMAELRADLEISKLPEVSKDRIIEKFQGKIFSKDDSKKEIDAEKKYLSRMMETIHPNGLKIEIGETSTDKLGDAVEGMLAGVDVNKIPRFKSLREAFQRVERKDALMPNVGDVIWETLKSGAASLQKKKSFKEAVTISGLGEIFSDRISKRMVAEYVSLGLDDWRKICTISESSNFLTQRRVRLGGYGTNMPTVTEGSTYSNLTSPTDEEATFSLVKKGGIETLSWESIKSDDMKALQLIPVRLGRGAKNTLYQFVFEFINPATNPTIYDAAALYAAGHGSNLRTAALSITEFDAIKLVMNDQAGYNEANFFVMNNPKYIVVPNELWRTANEIASSGQSFQGARTETVDNLYSKMNLEVIQVPYWTDNNNFATVADPKLAPGLEISFLDGNEEPELLQEIAGSGSEFTNDQIRYKLRHVYGGAITDFRPFVGNVVP